MNLKVNSMEERSKKTLEECKKLELKLAEAENRKKNMEKKYEQVGYGQHGFIFFLKEKKCAFSFRSYSVSRELSNGNVANFRWNLKSRTKVFITSRILLFCP